MSEVVYVENPKECTKMCRKSKICKVLKYESMQTSLAFLYTSSLYLETEIKNTVVHAELLKEEKVEYEEMFQGRVPWI